MLAERTPKEIFITIIHFSTVVTALLVVFSVDIWVANQGDIAANEEALYYSLR